MAHYVFRPGRMLRDIVRLHGRLREADLVVNDSFHPALLFMGALPPWRHKVVHVYGASLRRALEGNFSGRLPGWTARAFGRIVAWQIGRSRARIAHDFAQEAPAHDGRGTHRLATPVAVASSENVAAVAPRAAVYLNPHFKDTALADGLEHGLAAAGLGAHCVGEGYAGRAGWQPQDAHWIDTAARSAFIVSAPGMAALSVAQVYRKPILLLQTDQPEQASNAERAAQLGLRHRVVVWRGDAAAFASDVAAAARALGASTEATAAQGRDAKIINRASRVEINSPGKITGTIYITPSIYSDSSCYIVYIQSTICKKALQAMFQLHQARPEDIGITRSCEVSGTRAGIKIH